MFVAGAGVWATLFFGFVFVLMGGLVTLYAQEWHVKRPRWARDAKIAIAVLGVIALAPLMGMALVIAILSMIPLIVLAPFVAASDVQVGRSAA